MSENVRSLRGLAAAIGAPDEELPDIGLEAVTADSRTAGPNSLFVAVPGARQDGHDFVGQAVAAGAQAVVAERDVPDAGVPVVRVDDARRALATLAAEWWGRPAQRLTLVGVTGTVGKTTVVTMLERILDAAGRTPGVIGSLGAGLGPDKRDTGMTTPGPMLLQESLAGFRDHTDVALMEVTSHSLVQQRVHGLRFELGIFTNLVMLEHLEYHASFQAYVKAKLGFFDHLPPGAPLVYPAGDRLVAQAVADRDVRAIGCGAGVDVALHIERTAMTSRGTRLLFQIEEPLPRLDGGTVAPTTFPVSLQLLGRAAINNASLAAGAALVLGVQPEQVAQALPTLTPPRRRMQLFRVGEQCVLDDTVGHPDSVTGVFEVAEVVPHDRLFVVYAVRGRRGPEINRRDAEAVAIWHGRVPAAHVAVSGSVERTDEANAVTSEERDAFLEALEDGGVPHGYHERLEDAVADVLERAGPDDLIMLLGAQGMDDGLEVLQSQTGGEAEASPC